MIRATRGLVLCLLVLGLWFGGGLGAPAVAQDLPCQVDEGGVPAAAAGGGETSTTGQCAPSRRFRLIDSALWVFTLVVLGVVVVALVRGRRTEGDPTRL